MFEYSDKVLRHAADKLRKASYQQPAELLEIYQDFIKMEEHRLLIAHRGGKDGLDLAKQRSSMISIALNELWKTMVAGVEGELGQHVTDRCVSLVAVGGFGRGELSPFSDVDLLFLRRAESNPLVEGIIEKFLYVLWDIGFKVGHATRTPEEVVEQANQNLQTKTSMLECRVVAGSHELFDEFQERFHKECLEGKEKEYLAWRLQDQADRHRKYGGTVFMQEPHVKNGCGGLRDYHNLMWVARLKLGLSSTKELISAGWLTHENAKQIDRAYRFLIRVRNELHFQQKRAGEILTLHLQGHVADEFEYPQNNILRRTEALMRDYYHSARDVFHITNLLARRLCDESPLKKTQGILAFIPGVSQKIVRDGLIVRKHMIYHSRREVFDEEPTRLIRVFDLMQRYNASLSPDLETLIRQKVNLASRRLLWIDDAQHRFIGILKHKGKVGRILRKMHETGVLGRLLPEFEPLTCLVQHEFYHTYTADEHTMVCLEQLDRTVDDKEPLVRRYHEMMQHCQQPDVLYLAMLLHDVGKASNVPHHHEASAQLATKVAKRLKLKGRALQNLVFLVDHHMTLCEFAQRRNPEEIETVREFARIVQDQERLDMLMLMTFADGQGSAANANWSSWKELLVWNLYGRTKEMLKGEEEFLRRETLKREETLSRVRKLLKQPIPEEEYVAHFKLLPDRYLFSTTDELMARHVELINRFVIEQVAEGDDPLKPTIRWIHHEAEGHSEVVVVTWDRERLFSRISGAFALAGLNILSADIFTREDHVVVDTFRVCTTRFEAVTNKVECQMFEDNLSKSLKDPAFDFSKELSKARAKLKKIYGEEDFTTSLRLDNDTSPEYSLLHMQTPDRLGLLHDVTACMADLKINILHARITTEKGAALDTFYLVNDEDEQLDHELKQQLLQKLRTSLSPSS